MGKFENTEVKFIWGSVMGIFIFSSFWSYNQLSSDPIISDWSGHCVCFWLVRSFFPLLGDTLNVEFQMNRNIFLNLFHCLFCSEKNENIQIFHVAQTLCWVSWSFLLWTLFLSLFPILRWKRSWNLHSATRETFHQCHKDWHETQTQKKNGKRNEMFKSAVRIPQGDEC